MVLVGGLGWNIYLCFFHIINILVLYIMFLTSILMKRAKSKTIMVLMESVVSGHQITRIRERLADKLEFICFDPYIQQESLYKERKKIRSMKSS